MPLIALIGKEWSSHAEVSSSEDSEPLNEVHLYFSPSYHTHGRCQTCGLHVIGKTCVLITDLTAISSRYSIMLIVSNIRSLTIDRNDKSLKYLEYTFDNTDNLKIIIVFFDRLDISKTQDSTESLKSNST